MSFLDLSSMEVNEPKYSPMPQGVYDLQVVDADVKPTKSGTGEYIKCEFEVINHDTYNGRKIWQNFNIKNPNQQAVEIGMQQLRGLLDSAGKDPVLSAVGDLIGLQTTAKLKVKKSEEYGDRNEVHYFLKTENQSEKSDAPALDDLDDFDI